MRLQSSLGETQVNGVLVDLIIAPITIGDIAPYISMARSEHIYFTDNTDLYAIKDSDGAIYGFCGIDFQRTKAVFRNDYVLPEYRGNGLWAAMFAHRTRVVLLNSRIKIIEANCTNMSLPLYLNAGGKVVKRYTDLTKVRISL